MPSINPNASYAIVNDAVTDISVALDDMSIEYRQVLLQYLPAREHDGFVALLDIIRAANERIAEQLFPLVSTVDTEPPVDEVYWAIPPYDEPKPVMTDAEAAALIEPLTWYCSDCSFDGPIDPDNHDCADDLQDAPDSAHPHGIDRPAAAAILGDHLAANDAYSPYDGKHPCLQAYCKHTVLFDDEPYCYEHSPDSGSSVRGYSYRESQLLRLGWDDAADKFTEF